MHRASVPVIETARLRLRAPHLDDLGDWTRVFSDSFAEPDDSPDRAWAEFSCYTAGWMLHGHGIWTVERLSDGARLGFVLVGLEWGDEEPELGYMILPEHRHQGYAAEAASAARDFGLGLLGDLVSYVDPANAASGQLAARLGARRDIAAETSLAARDGDAIHVWRYRGARHD
ncbi:MAG: hypothetical protein RLZZ491_976 [Pseudomonadota bacterium]|jgi:RimJ/RimL family protein N-acetyltransferase